MKRRVLLILFILMIAGRALQPHAREAGELISPQGGVTLTEALLSFNQNNSKTRILEGRLEAARAEHHQSRLWPNPELGYHVEDSADKDSVIEVSWPVDISGRRGLTAKAARAGISALESLYQWEMNALQSDVKHHFYELFASQERLRITEEGARRYQAILSNVRSLSGSTDYDRLRLEKEVSEVSADADDAKREVIQLQTEFAILLNDNPNHLSLRGDLKSNLAMPERETLESLVLCHHPKIISALKESEQRNFERKAARRKWLPEINLTGGYKHTSGADGDDHGYVAGASISLPLFDRGQAAIQAGEGHLKRTEAEAALVKMDIEQRISKYYQETALLKQAVENYETTRLNAEKLEQMAGLAYLEGRLGILELLDAYRGAIQSRLRYVNLALESRLSEIELERVLGQSLEHLTEEMK